MTIPDREAIRKGLGRLAAHGVTSVWLPETQALVELPAVQAKLRLIGADHTEAALTAVLREAVAGLGHSQYRQLLTIVLALDERYVGLTARQRREIAGRKFRGGERPVSWGTIRQHHEPKALDQLTSVLLSPASQDQPADRSRAMDARRHAVIAWHPATHTAWAHERLSFWRLGFTDYTSAATVERVRRVMQEAGVFSWSLHETFGQWQVLVRAWVPGTVWDLDRDLERALQDQGLVMSDRFDVDDIVSDWMWTDPETGAMASPEDAALEHRLTDHEIAQLNQGAESDSPLMRFAQERNLLRIAEPASGIEFVMRVYSSRQSLTRSVTDALTRGIDDLLSSQREISEISLYRGMGFSSYLILGKIRYEAFHELRQVLSEPLLTFMERRVAGTGTASIDFLSMPHPLIFQEALPTTGRDETDSVETLLRQAEGPELEVKEAALASHDRHGSGRPATPDEKTRAALLRTVTGMLNSGGGTILIGAVEVEARPDAMLADAPRIGSYAVVGIEHELERGWDVFERRLIDACQEAIAPSPSGLVRVAPAEVQNRTVCVLTVSAPSASWFYLRERGHRYEFLVRLGNGTVALRGPEADQYKVEHPRR